MRFVLGAVLLVLFVSIASSLLVRNPRQEPLVEERAAQAPAGEPTFSWSYRSSERAGIPETDIILSAAYENGTTQTHVIDRIEGGCNEYEPRDSDAYERSTMIICYYAGLGRYYKIVERSDRYTVERKIFEEASPDYDPPRQEYEVVWQFLSPSA